MPGPSRASGHSDYAATRRARDAAARSEPLECGCRDGLHRSLNCTLRPGGPYNELPLTNHWRVDTKEAEHRLGLVGAPIPYPPHRDDAA
ncbi:hypothetical protein LK411_21765 [Tsukamurella paurometabola]|uniref:Uncharacterized protein n=1 Tax=Tsukamurella paurometabola TaxID=2061 RepID=A0A3P8L418_TSUPA|nr:hypothetical protein [Tsukamurella paurometabola]UEA82953.1 hypothetical protein LK411_21765 [Tsukamurella paurometabola]VDR40035.1 Uncharacterised protein [Tsukamurella paurometabola]